MSKILSHSQEWKINMSDSISLSEKNHTDMDKMNEHTRVSEIVSSGDFGDTSGI